MKWSNFKILDDVTNTLNEPLKIKFPDILLSDHEVIISNQVIERNSLKGLIFLIFLLFDNEIFFILKTFVFSN
jgi:hypothetical protein